MKHVAFLELKKPKQVSLQIPQALSVNSILRIPPRISAPISAPPIPWCAPSILRRTGASVGGPEEVQLSPEKRSRDQTRGLHFAGMSMNQGIPYGFGGGAVEHMSHSTHGQETWFSFRGVCKNHALPHRTRPAGFSIASDRYRHSTVWGCDGLATFSLVSTELDERAQRPVHLFAQRPVRRGLRCLAFLCTP